MSSRSPISRLTRLCLVLLCLGAFAAAKSKPSSVTWTQGAPGSTFERGDDGKYRYTLAHGDVTVTLAVDSQELEKIKFREEAAFGAYITVTYTGQTFFPYRTGNLNIEFVNHHHIVHRMLDPDQFVKQINKHTEAMVDQTDRDVKKHPELKEEKEKTLLAYQDDADQMKKFVKSFPLRGGRLGPNKPSTRGWVFFSTRDKFIGGLKKQEDLIIRVPIGDTIYEFAFKQPPDDRDLILRRR